MRLILASQSPRRREILSLFSLPFDQISPHFAEERVPFEGDPISYACTLAEGKAASVSHHHPHNLVLSADTVVFCEGKLYNKPSCPQENREMLRALSGKEHRVITALTGQKGKERVTEYEETKVFFHSLSEETIERYCLAFDLHDKAGGYAIQGSSGIIVKRIEGCYYNVMGLPFAALIRVLRTFGIDLWQNI